jgi:hypothetical protein
LHLAEAVWDKRLRFPGFVDHDWQDKRHSLSDSLRPVGSQIPLNSKVTFEASLRGGRNYRDEKHALPDLPADFPIPFVPVFKSALLVKPHLDARRPQRVAKVPRGLGILGSVTNEDGAGHCAKRCAAYDIHSHADRAFAASTPASFVYIIRPSSTT